MKSGVLMPLWLAVLAAGLLMALMLHAEAVLAPTNLTQPVILSTPAPSSGPTSNPASSDVSERTISRSQTTAPQPARAVPQSASETAPAAAPALCPPRPGSGLPCMEP